MRVLFFLLCFFLITCPARSQSSSLSQVDAIRLSEAYSLSEHIGESIWKGWPDVPFAILLLTSEKDYLIGHPDPSKDFASEGVDHRIGKEVFSRARTEGWSLNLLATFPAVGGLPTVVIGQPEATGKSSTQWVLTLLHEHFHQYQMGWDSYYSDVDALDLSGGDESGMWMLNYPFPYSDTGVNSSVLRLGRAIEANLDGESGLENIIADLEDLRSRISEKDYRYFSFQLWQEGVARYTELMVAGVARKGFESSPEFESLDDAISFELAFEELLKDRAREMRSMDLGNQGRTVFYALGSSLAMVLDRVEPDWRDDYFNYAFDLARFVASGRK